MPERGETVIGDRFAQGFGGKGANQAVMARLMGAEVAMVNAVGEDSYGTETMANFDSFGIDTTLRPSRARRQRRRAHLGRTGRQQPHHRHPRRQRRAHPEHGAAAVAAQDRVDAVVGQFEIGQAVTTAAFAAAREREPSRC